MMAGFLDPIIIGKVAAGGIWAVALSLAILVLRHIGPWSKQRADAETKLREELMAREGTLVRRIEKLEAALSRQQIRHNSERALDRHRLNNVTSCFDALLLLIETSPEKASEAVARIKEMRAAQVRAESEEKAIIRAAEIVADECEEGEEDD